MAVTNKRPLAVFQFKDYRKIYGFIGKVRAVLLSIGNAPLIFVTPDPTLASVGGHVDTLEDKQAIAETRVVGSTGQRDIAYGIVVKDVHEVVAYVQSVADAAPDVVTATAIINASGLAVKINGVIQKPPLAAKNGTDSGTIFLVALGGSFRTAHEWQISTNGITWTYLIPTINATTKVTGLTRLSTQYVRHRLINKNGPEAWSQVVNIVVL